MESTSSLFIRSVSWHFATTLISEASIKFYFYLSFVFWKKIDFKLTYVRMVLADNLNTERSLEERQHPTPAVLGGVRVVFGA